MKTKKLLFIILIGLIFTSTNVYAKQNFPSYSSTPESTYCKYGIAVSDSIYAGKEIYFVYSNGALKWVDPNNNKLKSSGSRWDTDSWAKQKVTFDSSIVDKMVTNGSMTKCATLYFRVSGDDLVINAEEQMTTQGSSEGTLMNGTTTVDDTHTTVKCPLIAGYTCLNGDACAADGLPTHKVTDITISLNSNGGITGEATNGYGVTIRSNIYDAKSQFTQNSCPTLYTNCSGKTCVVSRYKQDVLCKVTDDPVCSDDSQQDLSKTTCKNSTEYDTEYNRILADMKLAYQQDMSGYNSYDSLKRLIGSSDCNNIGNHFKAIGDKYILQIKNINNVINCKIDENSASNKEKEFETQVSQMTSSYTSAVSSKIGQLKNSGSITAAQANELTKLSKCVKDEVEQAGEKLNNEVHTYNSNEHGGLSTGNSDIDCPGLLGDAVIKDIGKILKWIKIAAPILVIILGSLDFAKAAISDDQKALSKAGSTFIKRMIAAVALFFAPSIIMYIIEHVDALAGGCPLSDFNSEAIITKINCYLIIFKQII